MTRIICFVLFVSFDLFSIGFIGNITKPGYYRLEDNITYNPDDDDATVIRISASDVILDLNQRILSQDSVSTWTEVYGIYIDEGLSNVTVNNGIIRGVNGVGIYVSQGCSNIALTDIKLFNCGSGCIVINGTNTYPVQNSIIEGCQLAQSCHCESGDSVLKIAYGSNLRVEQTIFYGNHNDDHLIKIIDLANCHSCFFNRIKVLNNYSSAFIGINLNGVHRCGFSECDMQFNGAMKAQQPMIGYCLGGNGNSNNIFYDCSAVQNSSVGDAYGFSIEGASMNNFFEECRVQGNVGENVMGFRLNAKEDNKQNTFFRCMANNNEANEGDADGFYINGSDDGIMIHCAASFNSGAKSASGVRFEKPRGGSSWFIKECNLVKNLGGHQNNSYGARVNYGKGNSFVNNFAFNNGNNSNNQLNGVPNGSKSNSNTNNLNTFLGFTNFQLTQ
jgi:hypothetical protein